MKATSIFTLLTAFAVPCLHAQTAQNLSLSRLFDANAAHCPVSLAAGHGRFQPDRVRVTDGRSDPSVDHGSPRQNIRLTLTNPSLQAVVGISVTLHGWSNKQRAVPTDPRDLADLKKTIQIHQTLKPQERVEREFTLGGFTTVTMVDLDSVTFADGSVWQSTAANACSVSPDLLMLADSATRP